MKNITLNVKKINRSWCICAGDSILGKKRTEAAAHDDLARNRSFYEYWAGSAGVSIENTPPEIKMLS